jgi:hypothetical protein
MAKYYFLASCLPSMPGTLGEKVPQPFEKICALILRNIEPADEPLVRCCLHAIDAANVEFYLQGQDVFMSGGILTREEIEAKKGLPLFLRSFLEERDKGIHRGYSYDALWVAYYSYAYSLAEEFGCRFLIDYLSWEIGLRNSLVDMRARARGDEAEDYQILFNVGGHDFSGILSQLKMQQNPLKVEQFLDEERLKRIYHCEGSDPFSRDVILGTLEKARIYGRWEKLNTIYPIRDII